MCYDGADFAHVDVFWYTWNMIWSGHHSKGNNCKQEIIQIDACNFLFLKKKKPMEFSPYTAFADVFMGSEK
jgi:hypothetical protein